jgi:hypothetical protein
MAVVVLLSTGVASARDFCFNSTSPPDPAPVDNPNILIVAQKFHLPKKGKCTAIVGWDLGLLNGNGGLPASGTACLSSAGTFLQVGVLIHAPGSNDTDPEEVHVSMHFFSYPDLTGGVVYMHRISTVNTSHSLNFVRDDGFAGPCGTIPIPG